MREGWREEEVEEGGGNREPQSALQSLATFIR